MGKSIVKQQPRALSLVEQEIAAEAKADVAMFQQGTARISHKGGVLTIDGVKVKDNKLTVAVISAAFGKAYYEGEFDPEVAQTPSCYGFHPTDPSQMKPHEAAPSPQHEGCKSCPHNKFGTAERGNGKRCKDEVRLMVVAPSGDDVTAAEVRMITVPPGSLKGWGQYVAKLADMGGTYRSVFTEISIEPFKGAYQLAFNPAGKLSEKQYLALKDRRESALSQSMQPYPVVEADERPRRPARRGGKASSKLD
jgi:hypothetical protein